MKRIAIIGGGIGGLTLALSLIRSGKFEVQVFEKAKEIRSEVGAGIAIQAAQVVLTNLGLKEEVKRTMEHTTFMEHRSENGYVLGRTDFRALLEQNQCPETEGVESLLLGTTRGNILDLLKTALPSNVIKLNKKFERFEIDDEEKVTVYFSDSTTYVCDVLVGADGIHSKVQQQLFGTNDIIFSKTGIYYGMASLSKDSKAYEEYAGKVTVQYGINKYFGIVSISPDEFVFFVVHKMDEPVQGTSENESTKSNMLKLVQGANIPHIETLINESSRLLHFGMSYRSHASQWHKGPIVLLGDSCHATLPTMAQGGNQAILDAATLGQVLCETDLTLDQQLQKYYDIRAPQTKSIVETSTVLMSWQVTDSWFWSSVRNITVVCAHKMGKIGQQIFNTWKLGVSHF
jgi:2-polyprenyl-6-methoxyphenol hydroxylase-like FAD-dependent oxidoreductase